MLLRAVLPLIVMVFLLIGCNKSNPEAYRSDPILADFQQQLNATNAEAEDIKSQMAESRKNIKQSVPQTGELGMHSRKLSQLQARLTVLEQQIRFWKIRIESRAKEAQSEYLESHKSNKPWPDPAKVEAYFAEKRLRQAKMKWDSNKRVEEYQKIMQKNKKAPDEGAPTE